MRYFLLCLLSAGLFAGCKDDKKTDAAAIITDSTKFTTIQWLDSTRDYGKIQEGQMLEVSFRFRNTGEKPLVIERVQPGCGCTVPKETPEPIMPGKEGEIKATFSSQGRVGVNRKHLTVYANTKNPNTHNLEFIVEVEKKAADK